MKTLLACAAAIACAGCTGGGSSAPPTRPSHPPLPPVFSTASWPVLGEPAGDGVGTRLSVRYPPGWHVYPPQGVMPLQFVYPIGSITSAPEHVACHHKTTGDATAYWCDPPRPTLRPGGVLIDWMWMSPMVTSRGEWLAFGGAPLMVDGWHASLKVVAPACDVGATQELDVRVFPTRHSRFWLELHACIRGPDTARADATVRAIVRSLRFASANARA